MITIKIVLSFLQLALSFLLLLVSIEFYFKTKMKLARQKELCNELEKFLDKNLTKKGEKVTIEVEKQ